MLEQPHRLTLNELINHVTQDRAHSVKPLVRLTDVAQAHLVEQNFLHDKDGDRLAQLGARFHDSEAEGNDFRREEEVDDVRIVVLFHKRSDDAQGGQTEVFEGTGFRRRVEEGVEEEGDMGREEERASVVVGGDALEEGEGVANSVRGVRGEGGWGEEGVDGNDFLEESGHDA